MKTNDSNVLMVEYCPPSSICLSTKHLWISVERATSKMYTVRCLEAESFYTTFRAKNLSDAQRKAIMLVARRFSWLMRRWKRDLSYMLAETNDMVDKLKKE